MLALLGSAAITLVVSVVALPLNLMGWLLASSMRLDARARGIELVVPDDVDVVDEDEHE